MAKAAQVTRRQPRIEREQRLRAARVFSVAQGPIGRPQRPRARAARAAFGRASPVAPDADSPATGTPLDQSIEVAAVREEGKAGGGPVDRDGAGGRAGARRRGASGVGSPRRASSAHKWIRNKSVHHFKYISIRSFVRRRSDLGGDRHVRPAAGPLGRALALALAADVRRAPPTGRLGCFPAWGRPGARGAPPSWSAPRSWPRIKAKRRADSHPPPLIHL